MIGSFVNVFKLFLTLAPSVECSRQGFERETVSLDCEMPSDQYGPKYNKELIAKRGIEESRAKLQVFV